MQSRRLRKACAERRAVGRPPHVRQMKSSHPGRLAVGADSASGGYRGRTRAIGRAGERRPGPLGLKREFPPQCSVLFSKPFFSPFLPLRHLPTLEGSLRAARYSVFQASSLSCRSCAATDVMAQGSSNYKAKWCTKHSEAPPSLFHVSLRQWVIAVAAWSGATLQASGLMVV